ncbi:hypothetical protein [Nesterenkonia sp. F]|uniref:hypothetical protein n=1 Tax=Nesterenkonia sp. F TaxID=795955 RepID=UPI000255CB22|nr:hypothetical protein [Nesterenkonia sp. F]
MTDRSSEPTPSVTSNRSDDAARHSEKESRAPEATGPTERPEAPEHPPTTDHPEPGDHPEPDDRSAASAPTDAGQDEDPEGSAPAEAEAAPAEETDEDSDEDSDESSDEGSDETADEGAPEGAEDGSEEEAPGDAVSSSASPAPRIRRSEPTPELPPEARETDESALSEFFDTLDARFERATARVAESLQEIIDGDRRVAEHDEDAEPDVPAVGSAAPRPPEEQEAPEQQTPAPGRPADADDAGPLGDAAGAAGADSADADASENPGHPENPVHSEHPEDTRHLPPTEGSGRLSLPGPPAATDDRPLPWDHAAGSRSASAERRRAVILEKASAIEAATSHGEESLADDERADDEEDLYTYIPPYNLPSRDPDPAPRPHDLLRRFVVTLGAGAAVLSVLWMAGWQADTRILAVGGLDGLVDGWYTGRRSLLTPNAVHYWLWPLIVVGLVLHALHQWAPSQRSTRRQRRSGWLVAAASWLMLGWTAAVHADMLWLAVLASLAAALALLDAVRQFTFHTARSISERRLTDRPVGLFAGWALVGAMSSVSIALTAAGVRIPGVPADLWGMLGLMATVWTGAYYAMTERGRMAVALGMGFGLICLVFPRLFSDAPSAWVAVGAAFGAFIVVLATESRRHRINHAERRAAMGRPVDDII